MTGSRNVTCEETITFGEEEVCRTTADIDDNDAFVCAEAIGAGCVEASGRSHVNKNRIQSNLHDGVRELFHYVVLDDDRKDVDMIGFWRDDQLIVPNDFLNRERDIACGFELGQLLDGLLVVVHDGKAAETHQGGLTGQ